MSVCRLCCAVKSSEELVISLSDKIGIITFKDLFEYFSRIKLDVDSQLPQRICKVCKINLVNFSEFVCTVEQEQQKLKSDINENFRDDEPKEKKQKLNELTTEAKTEVPKTKENSNGNVQLTQSFGTEEELLLEEIVAPLPALLEPEIRTGKRQRKMSIFVAKALESLQHSTNSVSTHLEEVDKIFGKLQESQIKNFETIQISKTKLLKTGEVPSKWLEEFKDFKNWQQMKFKCQKHCKEEFDGMFALLSHNTKLKIKDRSITCNFCTLNFCSDSYIGTFINHTTRMHDMSSLKFCCLICPKVFYNIPFLSQHYQTEHSDDYLKLYPCLECGLYCQSAKHLIRHKRKHDGEGSKHK